ncbi:MAG: alpha amylase catalytic region [Pseudonocardiales bacterium]|nr:alpha amylase catalytic region [Pseudonocardiales bacterium]
MEALQWWQQGAIYQIYPRSFADSNGDGVGDLPGVLSRLDYLVSLGISAIWLSPIYRSPMADFGYDISDYCDVDPIFGSLTDLDALVAGAHARGLKVVLDWVGSHTSDQHPWFLASRSSKNDPKRDWYVWRDPLGDGDPPNNWPSMFSAVGDAWTFDETTRQYYLHSFMREQPDLNWDNPEVEAAMHDVLRFWLDRGIDGFRMDAVVRMAKDPLLRDNLKGHRRRDEDWDTMTARMQGIRAVVDSYDGRMLVGELVASPISRFLDYLNTADQLHLAHNFVFIDGSWSAAAYRAGIDEFERLAESHTWPTWFLNNHDHHRVASRFDKDGHGAERARAIGVLLYTLRGTPFIYQGEELGLPDALIPADRIVDVDGRDPERAPMPWEPPSSAGPGAGFTSGEPWLPLIADAENLAASIQESQPGSTLNLYRRIARLRAGSPVLQGGSQRMVDVADRVLAWFREFDGERLLVAVNFSGEPIALTLPTELGPSARVVLSSARGCRDPSVETAGFVLRGSEAIVLG